MVCEIQYLTETAVGKKKPLGAEAPSGCYVLLSNLDGLDLLEVHLFSRDLVDLEFEV